MQPQPPLNFERLKDDDICFISIEARDIVEMFESVINETSDADVGSKATQFFARITSSAPGDTAGTEAKTYVEDVWQSIIYISSCIPPQHYGHDILVSVVGKLKQAGALWRFKPEFGMNMRSAWNHSPTFELASNDDDDRLFTLAEWISLNSFVARLYSAGVAKFDNCATWEMRNSLEEEDQVPADVFDVRVRVACEWMLRCCRQILQDSLSSVNTAEPTSGSDPFRAGPRFHGTRGFNLERWGFWKRRLAEVRKDVGSPLQDVVDEAIMAMTDAGREVASRSMDDSRQIVNGHT